MKRKNVLITGANSPFGKYICSYLKNNNNFKIYGISRRDENLEEFDEVFIFDIRKNIIPIEWNLIIYSMLLLLFLANITWTRIF